MVGWYSYYEICRKLLQKPPASIPNLYQWKDEGMDWGRCGISCTINFVKRASYASVSVQLASKNSNYAGALNVRLLFHSYGH